MAIKYKKVGQEHILYHDSLDTKTKTALFNTPLFDPEYLLQSNLVYHQAQGRGTTYFFNQEDQQWVLRHYWRGGLIGKCLKDQYVWRSLEATRAYQELTLLDKLHRWSLPSPTPIAARLIKQGLFYRADIITQAIHHSQSLVQRLSQPISQATDDSLWQCIGQTIAQFHRHGIYHDDLNAHNILISEANNISLIDFDKGKIIEGKKQWMEKNLERLHRSLQKEKTNNKIEHFSQGDWLALMNGYYTAMAEEHRE